MSDNEALSLREATETCGEKLKSVIILAAGQGKRFAPSTLPKVLHQVAGKPILAHVLLTAQSLNPERIIIVHGHAAEVVKNTIDELFPDNNFIWVKQLEQLGTGHAVKCAYMHLPQDGATLVLCGDVPLITSSTLETMLKHYKNNLVLLTANVENPTGYGRIVRTIDGDIAKIVEDKDAGDEELAINEINAGVYVLANQYLGVWLDKLLTTNQQNEQYLTDVVALASADNVGISAVTLDDYTEILGVNSRIQLEQIERLAQLRYAKQLLADGVTLMDKTRIDIRGSLTAGVDCCIDVNCVFLGRVVLGNSVSIGVGVILQNVSIGDGVVIKPYSIIEGAEIADHCQIGPFARIRPNTKLLAHARVGNFVEVKNSNIGHDAKVNHLSYIGDTQMGNWVNVGAGSVTCNYDGQDKFKTVIEDGVFVGSGTMLIAPVILGKNAVIGAGSTITNDAPAEELTVARAKQRTIFGWWQQKKKITT